MVQRRSQSPMSALKILLFIVILGEDDRKPFPASSATLGLRARPMGLPVPRCTRCATWSGSCCATSANGGRSCRYLSQWPRSRRSYSSSSQARRSPPARLTFSRKTMWRVGPCRASASSTSSRKRSRRSYRATSAGCARRNRTDCHRFHKIRPSQASSRLAALTSRQESGPPRSTCAGQRRLPSPGCPLMLGLFITRLEPAVLPREVIDRVGRVGIVDEARTGFVRGVTLVVLVAARILRRRTSSRALDEGAELGKLHEHRFVDPRRVFGQELTAAPRHDEPLAFRRRQQCRFH